jgi:hypothetical protein
MNKLLIGIPSRGYISSRWKQYIDRLFGPIPRKFVIGKDVATARIEILEYALDKEFTHLLFLDDDVFPPEFVLNRLYKTMRLANADLVNCPVWLKRDYAHVNLFRFVKVRNSEGVYSLITENIKEPEVRVGGVEPFDMAGLACTFLKTEILKRLEKPWLLLGYVGKEVRDGVELEYGTNIGEDFAFFSRCKDAGIKKVVDYGILCSHYEPDEDDFYPRDFVREMVIGGKELFHELPEPKWFLIEKSI